MKRWPPVAALVALYVLRIDLWWWREPAAVLGMPIGLAYHVAFCLVVSLTMLWLVRAGSPTGLQGVPREEVENEGCEEAAVEQQMAAASKAGEPGR